MVDLEELEMADLGETDMFDFEGTDLEDGLYEDGLYEDGFDGESSFEALDPEGYLYEGLDPEGTDLEWGAYESWGGYETSDLEADPFLGPRISKATRTISRAVRGGISPEFLKQLAQQAAKVAGGAIGGPAGASIAAQIAGNVLREGDLYYESSWESSWYETDAAMEGDPLMEEMSYNAAMAAEAASDQEAAPFIDAMANLAGPVLSSLLGETADPLYEDGFDGETDTLGERDEFLPALIPFAAPLIGRGIKAVGSLLSRNHSTRRFVGALPKVVAETAYDMRRLGRPTSGDVTAAMARRTTRALGNPTALSQTMRQNRAIAARAQARPAQTMRQNRVAAARAQAQPAMSMGAMGTDGAAPGNRGGMRRYGIFYGPPAPASRTGRRVVGYMLRPIYSSSRGRN
jgi:hypothetical protein